MKEKRKSGRSKRWVRRLVKLLILILILGGAGWIAYNSLKAEYKVTYDTYTATIGSINNALTFSGSTSVVDNTSYTCSSSATVRSVLVAAGEDVKKGQKLMRLSNGETIEAEFDGRVNSVSVEAGDEIAAGTTLLQVADFTHLRVSVRVDEYDIGSVEVGQAVTVTITANDKSYETEIKTIDHISQSQGNVAYYTTTCDITVDPDTDRVYPGMQATVSIPKESAENVVILKADALSFDETNSAFVYMYNEAGELEKHSVEVGVSNGNYTEIKSGLSDGDTVYVESKQETQSGLSSLLSGAFGSTQMNPPSGAGGFGGGSFDPSTMGGFSGGAPSGFGGSSGSGDRPSGFGGGSGSGGARN